MRRFPAGVIVSNTRGAMGAATALAAAVLLAAAAAPAGAVITPLNHDSKGSTAAAQAIAGTGFTTGSATFTSVPSGPAVGTADALSGLPSFPRTAPSFLVVSTGDVVRADQADQPGIFPSLDDGGLDRTHGDSAFDATVLRIPFNSPLSPAGAQLPACVSFDFRFLSEEYPTRLGSTFNDAFIAQLDSDSGTALWTTSGPAITAPNNFAALPSGQPVTIKATGVATMSPAAAAGTPYGAATGLLRAQVLVSPDLRSAAHSILLSLFDHGDVADDSAVFIDNLTLVPQPASCPTGLIGLGPAVAITGPTIAATVDTPTPTITGTADEAGDVTVRIYAGSIAAGAPVQTLPATRSGSSWSVVTGALTPGQYTVQATQSSAPGVDAASAPRTFTVAAAPGGAGGGSSSQQQKPGDKDNDGIPDDQDTSDGSLPPVPGKTFDARVVSGDVFIKYPPGAGPRAAVKPPKGFVPLKGAANVPMGAQLDTRSGRVAVTSAADTAGAKTQTADFYQGIFQVKQAVPKKKPKKAQALVTDLVMKGQLPRSQCAPLKGARAAGASKKKGPKAVLGSLWGNGKGKFRTSGKYSSATVRGTIWLTQDRCDGTLTKVKRGTVSVRDFKRRRTVSVKAGHSYLARAARAAAKAKGRAK